SLPYLNQLRESMGGLDRSKTPSPFSTPPIPTDGLPRFVAEGPVPTAHHITQNEINKWLYQPRWEAIDLPLPPPSIQPGHWLIFLDKKGVGQRLTQQLQEQGNTCTLISAGKTTQTIDQHHYQVNPANPQEIKQTVGTALSTVRTPLLRGILHLWS